MAILPQKNLFDYQEIERLGNLERLRLVLRYLPDETLMKKTEKKRGNGRNDYPNNENASLKKHLSQRVSARKN